MFQDWLHCPSCNRGDVNAEFAIFTDLTEERDLEISEGTADAIARDIVGTFDDRVDTSYDGWGNLSTVGYQRFERFPLCFPQSIGNLPDHDALLALSNSD